jgi:redox-sensing transcriptional repressor
MPQYQAPDIVIRRLPLYLQALSHMADTGRTMVSSTELGEWVGVTSAQIRKDLSTFGEFGKPGLGYEIRYLMSALRRILQLDKEWRVVIIGAGALGHALANHRGFGDNRFAIVGVFDSDPDVVGSQIGELMVQSMERMPQTIGDTRVDIAILAVPARAAQAVADQVIASGVRAILNYAPITLYTPADVHVTYIDPIARLQAMTYYL